MTSGLLTGLQLTITNNGNQHKTMTHGTQRSPVNISPSVIAEVTHTLDHNPMVVHHRLTPHPGTVVGVTGMRIKAGIVHRGDALVKKRLALLIIDFALFHSIHLVVTFHVIMTLQCRYDLL